MSSFMPPAATAAPAPDPTQSAAPDLSAQPQEDQIACPVCQGQGQIPASMSRDEILQAVDQNTQGSEPDADDSGQPSPLPSFGTPSNRMSMSDDQKSEVGRLGDRAKKRMSGPRAFGSNY